MLFRSAPHFAQDPCLSLNNYPLQSWNGLLFEKNPDSRNVALDLAHMGPLADLDFSGHVLDRVEMHECNYNWKTFIEVYLEDYHVGPFHPGLGGTPLRYFSSAFCQRWYTGEPPVASARPSRLATPTVCTE